MLLLPTISKWTNLWGAGQFLLRYFLKKNNNSLIFKIEMK